jgi:hypothetical protein
MAGTQNYDAGRMEDRPLPPLPDFSSRVSSAPLRDPRLPAAEELENQSEQDLNESRSLAGPRDYEIAAAASSSVGSPAGPSTGRSTFSLPHRTRLESPWSPLVDSHYPGMRPEDRGAARSAIPMTFGQILAEPPRVYLLDGPAGLNQSVSPVQNTETFVNSRSRSRSSSLSVEAQAHSPRSTSAGGSGSPGFGDPPYAPSQTYTPIQSRRHELYQQEYHNSPTDFIVPRWQPDAEVTICPICGTQFSFFIRKHHCRKCGRVVCNSCSPHRIVIPYPYIVRPPFQLDPVRSSNPGSRPHPDPSRTSSFTDVDGLGGGERVRLCNPCVPDPNVAPHQVASPIDQGSVSLSGHHNRSTSAASAPYSTISILAPTSPRSPLEDRALNPPRRSRQPTVPGSRPTRGASYHGDQDRLLSLEQPVNRSRSSTVGSSQNTSHQVSGIRLPTSQQNHRSLAPHSEVDLISQLLPARAMARPRHQIPEEDECPVCHLELPSRALPGFEALRETHIESCIANFMTSPSSAPRATDRQPNSGESSSAASMQAPASSSRHSMANSPEARMAAREEAHAAIVFGSQTPSPVPMRRTGVFPYKATEKDCVDDAECTICLEEFEVGVEMGRLECFCRFHLKCIQEWFVTRPGQCPVHQHGAGY